MRKLTKTISLLLCLLLMLQLVGAAAGEAFADGAPSGDSSVVWSVSAKDADGNDQTFTTAEEVTSALGPGFHVNWGKGSDNAPITAPWRNKPSTASGKSSPDGSSSCPAGQARSFRAEIPSRSLPPLRWKLSGKNTRPSVPSLSLF